jgi:hypothetical protein
MSAGPLRVGVIGGDAVCTADMASLASGVPVTVLDADSATRPDTGEGGRGDGFANVV